jgi:Domain of unknown function (DUF4160)
MPTISIFFGIIVEIYWRDHAPPHIHVWYQGTTAIVSIATGEVTEGKLAKKAQRIVQDWVDDHRAELMANWVRGENQQAFE